MPQLVTNHYSYFLPIVINLSLSFFVIFDYFIVLRNFIDTTRSVQSRVYETVGRPSVCLSVCPFHHSAAARRCGGFAVVGPAARRYRSIVARPALSSKYEQCYVVS